MQAFLGSGQTSSPSPTPTTTPGCNPGTGNIAQGKAATASGSTQAYGAGNVVDGDANSYWESANNAFPQWVQVDLGCAVSLSKVTLKLPPASAWNTRMQTLAVSGSTDGTSFTTLAASAGRTFDPATGNTVTINLPANSVRHLRITVTGNTGWPAGQLSELQAFAS
ncbi:discoidin domain-containing protein [Kitasatospora sp. KL5]|uniref:discoidin domain-containing protein n=1 Tax=Kitasatospora sp. KL5 TaxID=3425125 RepID=UPI003D6F18A9